MTMREQANTEAKMKANEMNHGETLCQEFFEGFTEKATSKSTISATTSITATTSNNNVKATMRAPNFAPSSFESSLVIEGLVDKIAGRTESYQSNYGVTESNQNSLPSAM